jgi:hypothetical protein
MLSGSLTEALEGGVFSRGAVKGHECYTMALLEHLETIATNLFAHKKITYSNSITNQKECNWFLTYHRHERQPQRP